MNTMTTILGFDIKGVSNPILMTEILIETPSERKEMTVPIDMDYMGIDEDTDFDMELSKDFISRWRNSTGTTGASRLPMN